MALVSEHNIARISFLYAIIIVTLLTFSTGALFIVRKIKNLQQEQEVLEKEFIAEQKAQLKVDVNGLIKHITERNINLETYLEENLKMKVEEASRIAINLHKTLKGKKSDKEIETIIREALRPIRVNEKHGYCFILEPTGKAILYPANPDLEGSNLKFAMLNSEKVVENLITIAIEKGNGLYGYRWYKPNYESDILYPKISYVTHVRELNWIIGSGEYLDELQQLSKQTITEELKDNLTTENPDYFFVYKLHNIQGGKDFATILVNNNRPDLIGKKISDDYRDHDGKQFRKEFMKGIRKKGEAYVVYSYKKPTGGYGRKLSYFKHYPKWDWIVARGIYFDRLETTIADQKAKLQAKVKNDIIILIIFFLGAVTIALIVAYHFSTQLQAIFNRYRREQQENLRKLKDLNTTLEKQNRTDTLTNIYNRSYFNEKLAEEIDIANRYQSKFCIMIFDIDHFKYVNDQYGHLAGDAVLKDFAKLIESNIRRTDTFARWGGEEFIILTPGITPDHALNMADKLRQLIEQHTFTVDRKITASFGISGYIEDEDGEATLQRADEALYRAKDKGRNRCVGPVV
ncbi:cache domain-containing protein [Desulfopila sp. IMCC35008]|uniref:sensor domain-containing diguanylate cyclase n=1 Tax=Desulfopila sp. IMCC35008 TaxID=2653858 RepID=UPI0013D84F35|nr:cache domain-containing protein [Desulfopila sp. IMCC35008]